MEAARIVQNDDISDVNFSHVVCCELEPLDLKPRGDFCYSWKGEKSKQKIVIRNYDSQTARDRVLNTYIDCYCVDNVQLSGFIQLDYSDMMRLSVNLTKRVKLEVLA